MQDGQTPLFHSHLVEPEPHSPNPAYGEVVQLDMLNDLIQQPVRHGVEICKRVSLRESERERREEKHDGQRSAD